MESKPQGPATTRAWGPIRIAGIYLLLGIFWILFSDRIAASIAPDQATLTQISIYKGWGYVGVTAVLLFLLTRRQAATLTRNERQLRVLTDALPALISYIDTEKRYRFSNLAYRTWFNRDVTGMHVSDALGPEAYQTVSPYMDAALAGQEVNYETLIPYRDVGERFVNATYIPDRDADHKVQGFFVLVQDVSRHKQAQEALRRSYQQVISFIGQAPLSIAMLDREMNYLAASRRWVMEYGRGHEDLIGRSHYELSPDLPLHWKTSYERGLAGETVQNDDDLWLQADGTRLWLRWSVAPWRDENDAIGGIIISAEDISARKRAEVSAFQNKERYHRVLDAMMEGCQIIDFEWRYVYVNEVAARQGRRLPEELLDHTMMEIYPGIDRTEMFAVLRRCMEDREPARIENRFDYPDGDVGWFELSIQPAQEGLFILSTDITDRKRAEKEIRRLNRELEQRIDQQTIQLRKFARSVSDDLRKPLRIIDGFTHLLSEEYVPELDDEGKRLVRVIHNEALHMDDMLADLGRETSEKRKS